MPDLKKRWRFGTASRVSPDVADVTRIHGVGLGSDQA